jgi:hypothetical protein
MRNCLMVMLFLVAGLALSGCGGGATQSLSTPLPMQPLTFAPCVAGGTAIPCTHWGLQGRLLTSYPVQVPYGQFRSWDSADANWPNIETCQALSSNPAGSCFTWTNLDAELTNLKQQGRTDIFYTLSRTPAWGSQNPTDTACNYSKQGLYGECWPPIDLSADGTRLNQISRKKSRIRSRENFFLDIPFYRTH